MYTYSINFNETSKKYQDGSKVFRQILKDLKENYSNNGDSVKLRTVLHNLARISKNDFYLTRSDKNIIVINKL